MTVSTVTVLPLAEGDTDSHETIWESSVAWWPISARWMGDILRIQYPALNLLILANVMSYQTNINCREKCTANVILWIEQMKTFPRSIIRLC